MSVSASDPWSLRFVRQMVFWSAGIAAAVAVAGGFLTRDWRFVVACVVGAAFDIGSLAWILSRTSVDEADGALRASSLTALLIGPRVAIKGLLVAAAFMLPRWFNMWGMFAGVLIFDATLMTVGSVKASLDMRRSA